MVLMGKKAGDIVKLLQGVRRLQFPVKALVVLPLDALLPQPILSVKEHLAGRVEGNAQVLLPYIRKIGLGGVHCLVQPLPQFRRLLPGQKKAVGWPPIRFRSAISTSQSPAAPSVSA